MAGWNVPSPLPMSTLTSSVNVGRVPYCCVGSDGASYHQVHLAIAIHVPRGDHCVGYAHWICVSLPKVAFDPSWGRRDRGVEPLQRSLTTAISALPSPLKSALAIEPLAEG